MPGYRFMEDTVIQAREYPEGIFFVADDIATKARGQVYRSLIGHGAAMRDQSQYRCSGWNRHGARIKSPNTHHNEQVLKRWRVIPHLTVPGGC
jgi:hypothetical protein